jgi:hypothetical protein
MDLYRLRHRPRPGPQRRDQRQTGRRTGGISLRSAGKTRSNPGTARRNRKPRIPDPRPCRVAAQQQVEKARILGLQPEEQVKGSGLTTSAEPTGDASHRWLLNANGQILSEASGKCLDVTGQATADGSRVILYSCNSGANEAWTRQ